MKLRKKETIWFSAFEHSRQIWTSSYFSRGIWSISLIWLFGRRLLGWLHICTTLHQQDGFGCFLVSEINFLWASFKRLHSHTFQKAHSTLKFDCLLLIFHKNWKYTWNWFFQHYILTKFSSSSLIILVYT